MSYDRRIVDQFVTDIRIQGQSFVRSFWSKISSGFSGDVLDQYVIAKLREFERFSEWTKATIMYELAEDIHQIALDTARHFAIHARWKDGYHNVEPGYIGSSLLYR